MGSGAKPPEVGEFSRIFVLIVTLQSVRLLLTLSYRENWGAGCITSSPIILLWLGEQLLPLPSPGYRAYAAQRTETKVTKLISAAHQSR